MQFIVISLKTGFFQGSEALVGVYRDQSANSSKVLTLDVSYFFYLRRLLCHVPGIQSRAIALTALMKHSSANIKPNWFLSSPPRPTLFNMYSYFYDMSPLCAFLRSCTAICAF